MGLGEIFVRAGLAVAITATAAGCGRTDSADASATRGPDGPVLTGPRISTSPNVLRPPEVIQDPLKKTTADYARALLDGRLDDLMNMTAAPYKGSNYRQAMQSYITTYSGCRDKKIIDVSIVENQGITVDVAFFDSACEIPFGSILLKRDHLNVFFQKVDGRQQPVTIDLN